MKLEEVIDLLERSDRKSYPMTVHTKEGDSKHVSSDDILELLKKMDYKKEFEECQEELADAEKRIGELEAQLSESVTIQHDLLTHQDKKIAKMISEQLRVLTEAWEKEHGL